MLETCARRRSSRPTGASGTFKQEARFSSWLYQIALNLCRDRLRRRRGRTMVSLDELEEAWRRP